MALSILDNRTVILVTGPEAEHFLQNLITTNVETLAAGQVRAGALLTPQGKVMFDFLISRSPNDGFLIDVRADMAADFAKRLTLYKLRAKVDLSVLDQKVGVIFGESESDSSLIDSIARLTDTRFGDAGVYRLYANALSGSSDPSAYDALRVAHGVVESGADFALSDAFAHDISLDQNGGVDFRKGCYVGQEVVSRMHHRKTARRRVVIVSGASVKSGAEVIAAGKSAGTIGTVAGAKALAICRLDRIKDAVESGQVVLVEGAAVTVSLPAAVSYDWPTTETADGENG